MSDNKPKNKEKRNKAIKKIIDITLALVVAGTAIYGISVIKNDFSDINRKTESSEASIISSNAKTPEGSNVIYVTEMADNDKIYDGALIVVNSDTEYKGKESTLVSMYDILQSDGTDSYLVMSSDVTLKVDAAKALNDMLKDFAKETGKKDIIVDGGYRSKEYQQELYDAAEDKSLAAKPGFSDYHTGSSVDFSISDGDDAVKDFTGEGDYSWFEENCYKYGYVVRFPEGKKEQTGYDYRPWHFRYVGKAHAYYMQKNNLCLEEYVEKLKSYDYTQNHLMFTDDNGKEYEAYYYPMDTTASTTILAVPDTDYQISGNNKDGFIIIFQKNSGEDASEAASDTTEASKDNKEAETKAEKASESSSKDSDESEEGNVKNPER